MTSTTEIFVWIVGIVISVLIGGLGWAMVEIYSRLKEDISGNAHRIDAVYKKADGAHTIVHGIQSEQAVQKKLLTEIQKKFIDLNDMNDRINIIGKKVTAQEKTLQDTQAAQSQIVKIWKDIIKIKGSKTDPS